MMKSRFRKSEGSRTPFMSLLIILLIVFFLNLFPGRIRPFFYYFSSPIQQVFWEWGEKTSDFFSGVFRGCALEKEAENLKMENQRLMSEIVRLKSLEEENKDLREAFEIGIKEDFDTVFASIISKDFSEDILLINKGEEEGVKEGMPVITAEKVLAGRIVEVYNDYSKVEVVSNKDFSFDVKILNKEITALARGEGNFKILIDLIPKESELAVGDSVVTAGLEESIPSDLLVGRIEEVRKEDVESMQKALVVPGFSLDRNFHVFVIKSK